MENSNDTEVSTKLSEEASNDAVVSTEFSEEDPDYLGESIELSEEERNNLDAFGRFTGTYEDDNERFYVESDSFETKPLNRHLWLLKIEEDYLESIHREYLAYRDIPWGRLSDASQRRYNCFDLALRAFPPRINTYFNNDMRVIFFVLLDKFKLYEAYKFFVSLRNEVYGFFIYFIDEAYGVFADFIEEVCRFFTHL